MVLIILPHSTVHVRSRKGLENICKKQQIYIYITIYIVYIVKFTLCTCVSAVRTVFDLHLPSFPLKTGRAVALQKARPRRFSAPSCFRVCGLRVPLLPFSHW